MKGSINKNKKTGKWDFIVDIGKDPFTGKRKQKRKRGYDSKEEAEKALTKLLNELNEGRVIEVTNMYFDEFFDIWLEERILAVEKSTYNNNITFYNLYIKPKIGGLRLKNISPLILQRFVNELVLSKKLSSGTIHKIFDILKVIFKKAIKLKLLSENPAQQVELPKIRKNEINVWDIEEVNTFLQKCKNVKRPSKYYTAYLIAILTGMRQGEILGLRWKDIEFDKGLIYIRQVLSHDAKEMKIGAKTVAGVRTIHISEMLTDQLKEEKLRIEKQKLKLGQSYEDNDLVICTREGKPIIPTNLVKAFKKDVKKVGLPIIRWHDLRHTHATMLIERNVNPKIIQERLGHSRIGVTLDIYSHVLPSMQREAVAQLDSVISL
ncbi:tyrosine-type recombinase/integrase [Schinkia azotoformans]|uniref:site-specific integrase n=1 Tax=Schinkia azotoformans TaxID=1454 RepID=UPI002DB97688|nr:tyrosine-type recombinase/integrase [Schinkia azotoformans]MEC1725835.1 tyrosine-type recombinase/integrase [Schinkia azotoformans]